MTDTFLSVFTRSFEFLSVHIRSYPSLSVYLNSYPFWSALIRSYPFLSALIRFDPLWSAFIRFYPFWSVLINSYPSLSVSMLSTIKGVFHTAKNKLLHIETIRQIVIFRTFWSIIQSSHVVVFTCWHERDIPNDNSNVTIGPNEVNKARRFQKQIL